MTDLKVETYYLKKGTEIVDMLHDKGFLASDLSRESSRALEEFIGFYFQSECHMASRVALLEKKHRGESKC